jgi:hypothetical protein
MKNRSHFNDHLKTYVTMNFFCWILWFFAGWRYFYISLPWPLWVMTGWGIGLLLHYYLFNTDKK